jgi:ABC-2 type transport system permease protein
VTSVFAAERIKLLTIRSPWWCAVCTVATGVTLTVAYIVTNTDSSDPATVWKSQFGVLFAFPVTMVMAGLAVTSEYRYGTIRTTFQAVPDRISALLAKTALVALLSGAVGEVTAFASWLSTVLVRPDDDLGLVSGQHWRNVSGAGLYFAIGAVMAVALALLVRQTAGTVAALVAYPLAGELFLSVIPGLDPWLPLNVGKKFLTGGVVNAGVDPGAGPGAPSDATLPWEWALGYYAAIAVVLFTVALLVAARRDA